MNIIELQERLKDLPEQALMQEMQAPSGTAPQFLVLSELKRRKRMRDEYQRQQAQGVQTVAEEAITAAGAPAAGIMQMSRAMAPQSAIAQNTGVNDMMQQESVRAPQPEQPMMMADGGYVQRMRDGGFGENVEYNYETFLQEMGLNDTPDARDAFRRYQDRMNTQYALEGPNTDPSLFTPGIDRPPQGIALSDVSTDVDAFLPGASARPPLFDIPRLDLPPMSLDVPPMTSAPPALISEGSDTIDFDASVEAAPAAPAPREPESYLDTMLRITGEAADVARGMGIPIPKSQRGISIDDIVGPGDLELGRLPDVSAPVTFSQDVLAQLEEMGVNPEDFARLSAEEQQNILEFEDITQPMRDRFAEAAARPTEDAAPVTPRASIEDIVGVSELEYGGLEGVNQGEPSFDRMMRDLGFGPAMDKAAQTQQAARERERAREAAGQFEEEARGADRELLARDLQPVAGTFEQEALSADAEIGALTGGRAPRIPLPDADDDADRRQRPGGAGNYGAIEDRIARMLEERERSAQADKWLSLAQTGLALMASDQPTIGGAIGEAGLAGIGAMQKARSQYDKDIMELLNMQAGVQRARDAGARAGAPRERTPAELKGALEALWSDIERLATPIYGPDPSDLTGMKQIITRYDYSSVPADVMNDYTRLRDQYLQMFQSPVDVTS